MRPKLGEICSAQQGSPRCIDSFCQQSPPPPFGGTCAPYLTAGQTCNPSDDPCAIGLTCASPDAVTYTCVALPALGEPCTAQLGCRDLGQRCDPASSTCVALGLPGDPCTTASDCAPFYSCDTSAGACLQNPGIGEPCFDVNCSGGYCGSGGVCRNFEPDGAACDFDDACQSEHCDVTCSQAPGCP